MTEIIVLKVGYSEDWLLDGSWAASYLLSVLSVGIAIHFHVFGRHVGFLVTKVNRIPNMKQSRTVYCRALCENESGQHIG